MKAHDEAGNSLNKFQHCGEDIKPYDVVFDENTFEKTKNLRSSLYSVVYISKDKKSLLIAKPKPQILRKSKYPNSKVAEPDIYYTKAHLHLEYISRDIRSLNFICHGDNIDLVIFHSDWRPLQMEDYLEDIMKDKSYSIKVKASVLSRRDNIDIKDTISLLERQLKEKEMKPKIEVLLPKPKIFSDFQEALFRPEQVGKPKNLKDMANNITQIFTVINNV